MSEKTRERDFYHVIPVADLIEHDTDSRNKCGRGSG